MQNIYTEAYEKNLAVKKSGQPILVIKPNKDIEFLPWNSMIFFSAFMSLFLFVPLFFLSLFAKGFIGFLLGARIHIPDGILMGCCYVFTVIFFPVILNILLKLTLENTTVEIYKEEMIITISLPFYYFKKALYYSKINDVSLSSGPAGSNYNFSFISISVENGKGIPIIGLDNPSEFVEFVKTRLI